MLPTVPWMSSGTPSSSKRRTNSSIWPRFAPVTRCEDSAFVHTRKRVNWSASFVRWRRMPSRPTRSFANSKGTCRLDHTPSLCFRFYFFFNTVVSCSQNTSDPKVSIVVAEKLTTMDFYGHPTGIRSIAISSDDRLACTVSKNVTKIWNVASRSCIQSISPSGKKSKGVSSYGLCTAFLPGNVHVAVGTREGHLLLIDIAAGEVVHVDENAHQGAIWSLDIRRPSSADSSVTVVTGSADKSVKFWSIESQDDDDDQAGQPMFVHTRTLQMTDDVICVRYSHSLELTKRMVFVSKCFSVCTGTSCQL
jgi:WD40 repeat protein